MKNPDTVLRELGQLYDFNKEIARFRIRKSEKPNAGEKKAVQGELTPRTRF